MILTVDPGVRACGCALWLPSGELVRAAYVEGGAETEPRGMFYSVEEWVSGGDKDRWGPLTRIVVERPQTYHGRATRGDANDLLDVALVVGALSTLSAAPLRLVLPSEWKGQVPKSVTRERCWERLSAAEITRVVLPRSSKLAWNVWDAVGIGLWLHGHGVKGAVDKRMGIAHG